LIIEIDDIAFEHILFVSFWHLFNPGGCSHVQICGYAVGEMQPCRFCGSSAWSAREMVL